MKSRGFNIHRREENNLFNKRPLFKILSCIKTNHVRRRVLAKNYARTFYANCYKTAKHNSTEILSQRNGKFYDVRRLRKRKRRRKKKIKNINNRRTHNFIISIVQKNRTAI
ncbi:hypothetical protein PUN28_003339 [Cardiocondyla obscurior]|uniref:Uncharacterized protein n=1 Tax=Cardiocondyla obscurior TaxID=286306 RepID=A0AAW2GNC5_9HYME